MRGKKFVFSWLATAFVASFLFVGLANAHSFRTGDSVSTSAGEKINQTLFVSGRNIDIASDVDGDIYCAGQNVTISGDVKGDILCAAQTLKITGTVDGDIRVAGQTVEISADVIGSASVGSQTFTLSKDGRIGKDISLGAQDATFDGDVGRDIAAGSDGLKIAGSVGRDIKGEMQSLSLSSTAKVAGNIDYTSTNEISRDGGAQVSGTIKRTEPQRSDNEGGTIGFLIYLFGAMLFIAMVFVLLLPKVLQAITNVGLPWPWKAMVYGIVTHVVFSVLFVLLLITVVGIPLALLLGMAWLFLVVIAGPVTAYYLGRLLLRKNSNNALLYMLAGSIALFLLLIIPVINFLTVVFILWAGVGMIVVSIFSRISKPSYIMGSQSEATSKSKNTKK